MTDFPLRDPLDPRLRTDRIHRLSGVNSRTISTVDIEGDLVVKILSADLLSTVDIGSGRAFTNGSIVMATETLHFENARFAQQLFNNEPRNLQSLETELGVKATSREGWIKLEGQADAIERAKHLFVSLETLSESRHAGPQPRVQPRAERREA